MTLFCPASFPPAAPAFGAVGRFLPGFFVFFAAKVYTFC